MLSGGNQQKIVLAKWMARSPTVLMLDEPTRGLDIKAKRDVHDVAGLWRIAERNPERSGSVGARSVAALCAFARECARSKLTNGASRVSTDSDHAVQCDWTEVLRRARFRLLAARDGARDALLREFNGTSGPRRACGSARPRPPRVRSRRPY